MFHSQTEFFLCLGALQNIVDRLCIVIQINWPFPSSPRPLYQNEVKCPAFEMEMTIHSYSSKTHFHKKGCALGLMLKVRGFGSWKWPFACTFVKMLSKLCILTYDEISGD